ncbi:Tannase and feruloyl esterase [Pseudogymnoascus verrucosus]|uniref:Carboxylic ester hydrolase n=1 Tax=Pseudogymnoascus verrucosus TaxID=342668 RepID=A0A1B8GQC2_9PEZI|nr:Tannase and feruloyl esterase [Pseudogymnoascus verrucosus]OBT98043.2 Tannase and feruloyl esterase [Pseudogymnoascus verrucosus]
MKFFSKCLLFFHGLTALTVAQQIVTDAKAACGKLGASLAIENVHINFVQYLPAGTNISLTQNYNLSSCGYVSQVVSNDLCRVAMYVATSYRSGITLEAWLPTNWTGRFLSTGNGGIGGCIQYADLAYAAGLGFATVGANNGHNGTSGYAFYRNMDVVHDFVDRSLHTGVVVGKEIVKRYYGAAHKKSYYLGCSTGGRQGFKAVQSYPNDFDGVVAGAPAIDFTDLTSWSASFYTIFGSANDSTFVPAGELWALIHQEILNQCDSMDGVVDDIIEDPLMCQFRPEALQCPPGTTNFTSCLTNVQVSAVREAFTDFYGLDGKIIYPRMQPGSELIAEDIYYTTGPFPYSVDWFRYVVYNNPNWNAATFNRLDAKAAADQNPFNIQTWNGDLSDFRAAGGKLLTYHGQADYIISSDNSPRYYDHVSRTMGLPSSDLDEFYRFFRISGMGHCGGGVGAHAIGQTEAEVSTLDPQNNVLLRMVDWVENGNAPVTVTGTKYINDDPSQGVSFVRNHCKYPLRNFCTDGANYKSPESWTCIE